MLTPAAAPSVAAARPNKRARTKDVRWKPPPFPHIVPEKHDPISSLVKPKRCRVTGTVVAMRNRVDIFNEVGVVISKSVLLRRNTLHRFMSTLQENASTNKGTEAMLDTMELQHLDRDAFYPENNSRASTFDRTNDTSRLLTIEHDQTKVHKETATHKSQHMTIANKVIQAAAAVFDKMGNIVPIRALIVKGGVSNKLVCEHHRDHVTMQMHTDSNVEDDAQYGDETYVVVLPITAEKTAGDIKLVESVLQVEVEIDCTKTKNGITKKWQIVTVVLPVGKK